MFVSVFTSVSKILKYIRRNFVLDHLTILFFIYFQGY